jgi:hypothetical protein
MKPETSEQLREAFDALRTARALLIAALDQYAEDSEADEDSSKQSQYERKIAALEARVQMAENEYKIWEAVARLEGVEAERDRAIQQMNDERSRAVKQMANEQARSDAAQKQAESNQRQSRWLALLAVIGTLVAGALPALITRSPANPEPRSVLPTVFSGAIVSRPTASSPMPTAAPALISSSARPVLSATPPPLPSTTPRR